MPHPLAIVIGAGSGVGQAATVLLAQAGYHILLVGRTQSKLDATLQLAWREAASGIRLEPLCLDVTQPGAARQVVDEADRIFGRIDAIANVAGYATLGTITDITPEGWQRTVDTNLSYVMAVTAAAWPILARRRNGVIVNVSSMASVDPFPGFAMYAAAKAGLNMFTHVTGQEGGAIGLKAVAIAPGAIETPLLRSLFDENMVPPDKAWSAMDIATVIRDCITGKRAFASGETIIMPSPQ